MDTSLDVNYVQNTHTGNYIKTDNDANVELETVLPSRMQIVWTGGGYYTKYTWKGDVIYHRSSKKEGILYREKPQNKDGINVIDVERYDQMHDLESFVKHQLLDDFQKAGIKVTNEMREWAKHSKNYKWQFYPSLKVDQIIALNRNDWHGCVWTSEHHTLVTIHPRLMDLLSN